MVILLIPQAPRENPRLSHGAAAAQLPGASTATAPSSPIPVILHRIPLRSRRLYLGGLAFALRRSRKPQAYRQSHPAIRKLAP